MTIPDSGSGGAGSVSAPLRSALSEAPLELQRLVGDVQGRGVTGQHSSLQN